MKHIISFYLKNRKKQEGFLNIFTSWNSIILLILLCQDGLPLLSQSITAAGVASATSMLLEAV